LWDLARRYGLGVILADEQLVPQRGWERLASG